VGVAAVVVAAGEGRRFGSAKQFAALGPGSVAARSVRACRAVADLVILVVPADYAGDGEGADLVAVGGKTRSASVRAGLAQAGDAEIVVVHDAARPWASAELFGAVVGAVREGADGAVPGLALTDTVKRVSGEGTRVVTETIARDDLVAVQTPQAFSAAALARAHAAGDEASDDAALVERVGGRVVVVAGEPANRKITRPEDLVEAGAGA
jgi:2-C-methyl-D-erythritol 4-phosphate cytidylyltransferase